MSRKKKTPAPASVDETPIPPTEAAADTQAEPTEGEQNTEAAAPPEASNAGEPEAQAPAADDEPAPTPEPKPKTDMYALKPVRLHLRVNYTDAEKLEFSRSMVDAQRTIEVIEDEKKRANTQFKSRIESATAERDEMMDRIKSGYEMREVVCKVTANWPEVGKKTIERTDTGDIVRVEAMSESERQMELPGVAPAETSTADDAETHEYGDPVETDNAADDDSDEEETEY